MQQLLWIETLLKFAAGLVLVAMPGTIIKLLGLPKTDNGYWPRLLGIVLLGLAGALFWEGRSPGAGGLGLPGVLIVNLCAIAVMVAILALDAGPPAKRGRAAMWSVVLALVVLSILEIANL